MWWSRSLLKIPCSANFYAFHGTLKFSMIGLGQEDEIEEITLQPEIWWHDAVYHEADHCMKWPHLANVCIFWSRPAEGAVVLWTSFSFLYFSVSVPIYSCPIRSFLGLGVYLYIFLEKWNYKINGFKHVCPIDHDIQYITSVWDINIMVVSSL